MTLEEIVRVVTGWLASLADLSGAVVVGVPTAGAATAPGGQRRGRPGE